MDDPELEAIRQKRLAELASGGGGGRASSSGDIPASVLSQLGGRAPGGGGGRGGGGGDEDEAARAQAEEEKIRTMVSQILDSDARERLSRIALVRPQRARAIQELLIRMAQSGQLRGKVSEDMLIGLLDQVEAAEAKGAGGGGQGGGRGGGASKITFSRKDAFDDDDFFD